MDGFPIQLERDQPLNAQLERINKVLLKIRQSLLMNRGDSAILNPEPQPNIAEGGQGDVVNNHQFNRRSNFRQYKIIRQQIKSCAWTFVKLFRFSCGVFIGAFFILLGLSILASSVWDYRIVESKFVNVTSGFLTEKHVKAIGHWQIALNELVHDLDPMLPIYQMEEEEKSFVGRCMESVGRAWYEYWCQ